MIFFFKKGENTAGLFSNDDELANNLLESSKKCNESLWRMPILEDHRELIKGEVADITNSTKTRYGGARIFYFIRRNS